MREKLVGAKREGSKILLRLAALSVLGLILCGRPAAAIEITCIESSRYGYLYKLFGDDRQRFAAYFNLDPATLPAPETCRAALISGKIEPKDVDAMKLIDMIGQNGGWLDTLYLNSPGGNVVDGILLALATRDFWLKTRVAPPGAAFVFEPDFGPPGGTNPPDPGRLAFDRAAAAVPTQTTVKVPQQTIGSGDGDRPTPVDRLAKVRCASACTYMLAAGVDRRGTALVHRPHNAIESIQRHGLAGEGSESRMMALYRKMDVGDAFMAATRATTADTVTPVIISRYPRFIEDALLGRCKSDGAQLDDLDALLRFAGSVHGADLASAKDGAIPNALGKVEARRREVSQCVAVLHEKERLAAFQRYCPPGCTRESLQTKIREEYRELVK